MLIGLGKDKTSVDFWFTRLEGKVTRVPFVKYNKNGSRSLSLELFITELLYFIGLGGDNTSIHLRSLGQKSRS